MTAVAWNRPDALRVNQLDANQLDCELAELVAAQLVTALRVAWPAVSVYTSEAAAVSEAVLLLGSIAQGAPSPGAALVGLKYSPGLDTKQRLTLRAFSFAVEAPRLIFTLQFHSVSGGCGVSLASCAAAQLRPLRWCVPRCASCPRGFAHSCVTLRDAAFLADGKVRQL